MSFSVSSPANMKFPATLDEFLGVFPDFGNVNMVLNVFVHGFALFSLFSLLFLLKPLWICPNSLCLFCFLFDVEWGIWWWGMKIKVNVVYGGWRVESGGSIEEFIKVSQSLFIMKKLFTDKVFCRVIFVWFFIVIGVVCSSDFNLFL